MYMSNSVILRDGKHKSHLHIWPRLCELVHQVCNLRCLPRLCRSGQYQQAVNSWHPIEEATLVQFPQLHCMEACDPC